MQNQKLLLAQEKRLIAWRNYHETFHESIRTSDNKDM